MTSVLKILEARYQKDLVEATDTIFELAASRGWSWEDLAEHANLSYATVWRLGSRVTQLPRWQTFWKLAQALGLRAVFIDAITSQRISLEDIRASARKRQSRRA